MVGVIYVYVVTVFGFYGFFLNCLVGCFNIIVWTPAVLSVLFACLLYFCICPCSAQLSMFHTERRSRNTLININNIIITIIIILIIIAVVVVVIIIINIIFIIMISMIIIIIMIVII